MNPRSRLQTRAAIMTLIAALGAATPFMTSVSVAKPAPPKLELWPDHRVLLLLPLKISEDWNADTSLGQAILPLAQPQLQKELTDTGKFSITLPYRFDPVLRRALVEKRLAENDIKALLDSPTLITARPILSKLVFDQPVMMAEVKLEELRIGGTPEMPTVQIKASGVLYEQDNPNPFRSVVITSHSMGGKTPSDRIRAAANDAFKDIADAFIAPPAAFDLPIPDAPPASIMPAPGMPAPGKPAGPATPIAPTAPIAPVSPS